MSKENREQQIRMHRDALRRLEASDAGDSTWPPDGFYFVWHLVIGSMIGGLGAMVALIANAVGASLVGLHPFQLIRVLLTFPMGERALQAEAGEVLTIGTLLFLATGALYGIAYHLWSSTFLRDASFGKHFLLATAFGIGLWVVNFYLILSWLQPALLGGNWIVRLIPVWVGALTHLAFAWSMYGAEILWNLNRRDEPHAN